MDNLERIIISPPKQPIGSIIWLHGLGADAEDSANTVKALPLPDDLSLRFILPHAPIRNVTVHQNMPMRAWYDIYSFERLDQEDVEGILAMQHTLQGLIQDEMDQGFEAHQIIVAGFSQGGAMALRTGLCHPERLGGILALSTYLPLPYQLPNPETVDHNLPIFIGHGQFDPVLPIILGQSYYQQLKQCGYTTEWHDYPVEHQLCDQELQDISNWLVHRFS